MDLESMCRCCLVQGVHKDANATYVWFDKKEIYSDMLNDCFKINLCPSNPAKICDECIKHLRRSLDFRQQVLRSEKELYNQIEKYNKDENKRDIKLEPKSDSDDESDCLHIDTSRDCSLDLEDINSPDIKGSGEKDDAIQRCSSEPGTWNTRNYKQPIKKTHKVSEVKLSKKLKRLSAVAKRTKIKKDPIWTARMTNEKIKHRENLISILKYSNATPFKNKSLLGFTCGYCEGIFPDPIDLRAHTTSDHSKERLNFKSSFDMSEFNVKLDVSELKCSLCDLNLDSLTSLKEHLVHSHDKQFHNDIKDHLLQFKLKKGDVYDCAMCTSTYETFKMLIQHMNKHYSNYTCEQCSTAFTTKRSLNAHIKTHQQGVFKCDFCEKIFTTKPKKQYHEKTKHLGTRHIKNCPYCNEEFRSYYQRNQHLVKIHNVESQYKCNVCQKTYMLKSLLMYHIKKSHLMERNCQCVECGHKFFSKKALKAHMIKHNGERIYSCEICNKSYARKYTLREHLRIHNNDRRFKCDVCSMTFVQKCSLKSHLLSNHGISMAASNISIS